MLKQLNNSIKMRLFIQFVSLTATSMLFPFMAIYYSKAFSSEVAGILLTITLICQLAASLYGGHLSDLIGRKILLNNGEILKLIGFSGLLLANLPFVNLPIITFLMMIVIAIGQGILTPASEAMLIDLSTEANRPMLYSAMYWVTNLSIMVGILVGAWLFSNYFLELLLGLLVISFMTSFLTIKYMKETLDTIERPKLQYFAISTILKNYISPIKDTRFLLFTLGGILLLTIEYQRSNYMSIHFSQSIEPFTLPFGLLNGAVIDGVQLLSILTIINTVCIILFTSIITRIISTKNTLAYLCIGIILFSIGFAISVYTNNIYMLLIMTIISTLGELLYVPTRQTILAGIINHEKRGAYIALNGMVYQIGKIVAALTLIFSETIGSFGMLVLLVLFGVLSVGMKIYALRMKTV